MPIETEHALVVSKDLLLTSTAFALMKILTVSTTTSSRLSANPALRAIDSTTKDVVSMLMSTAGSLIHQGFA